MFSSDTEKKKCTFHCMITFQALKETSMATPRYLNIHMGKGNLNSQVNASPDSHETVAQRNRCFAKCIHKMLDMANLDLFCFMLRSFT